MLEKRLVVLRGILDSEEVYLRELDALLAVTPTNSCFYHYFTPFAFSLTAVYSYLPLSQVMQMKVCFP